VRVAIESGRSGMVTTRDTIHVIGNTTSGILLSDLAIGARTVNLPWLTAAGDTAWSNPLASFSRTVPMQLYYEVAGLPPGTAYRTDVALLRPRGGSVFSKVFGGSGAAIKLGFDGTHPGGIDAIARELNLDRVKPGSYVLEVVVTTRDGKKATRRRQLTVSP